MHFKCCIKLLYFKWHCGGCLTYTSAPLRGAVKHPPNNSLKLGKKTKLKAERIGAFAAEPLCESPRNLRTAAYLSYKVFFYTYVFIAPYCFGRRKMRRLFFIALQVWVCMVKVEQFTQSSRLYPKVSGKVCYILFSYFV